MSFRSGIARAAAMLLGPFTFFLPVSAPAIPAPFVQGSHSPPNSGFGPRLELGKPVRDLAVGEHHVVALFEDGTVEAWGLNGSGQCDVPDGLQDVIAVAAGYRFSAALSRDGSVSLWGETSYSGGRASLPPDLQATAIWAEGFQFVAQRDDRSLYCLEELPGWKPPGRFLDKREAGSDGETVLDCDSLVTLSKSGSADEGLRMLVGGKLLNPQPILEEGESPVSAWTIGARNDVITLIFRTNRQRLFSAFVYRNFPDEKTEWAITKLPPGRVRSIAMGSIVHFCIMENGDVFPWGYDFAGMAGMTRRRLKARKVASSPTDGGTLVLREDWRVVGWHRDIQISAHDDSDPSLLFGTILIPATAGKCRDIARGFGKTVLVGADGLITAWGEGWFIGLGIPPLPPEVRNVTAAAITRDFIVTLHRDGTITKLTPDEAVPIPVLPSRVTMIAGGENHALALTSKGTVIEIGVPENETPVNVRLQENTAEFGFPQDPGEPKREAPVPRPTVPRPESLGDIVAIAAGVHHSLALRADGSIAAWGDNTDGQCLVPADIPPCKDIAGGESYSVALTKEGSALVWGFDTLPVPRNIPPLRSVTAATEWVFAITETGELVSWLVYPETRNGRSHGREREAEWRIPEHLLGLGNPE